MMHLHLPIPAFLRTRFPLGRRLGLPGGRILPIGIGLAGLVVLAGVHLGGPDNRAGEAPAMAVTGAPSGEAGSPAIRQEAIGSGADGQGARAAAAGATSSAAGATSSAAGISAAASAGGAPGSGAATSARQPLPGPVVATVLRVTDGDTLAVTARIWLGQEVQVLVRLRGVDAPEKNGACAEEKAAAGRARDQLAALSGGTGAQVTLTTIAPDKYNGRVIADVESAAGVDLARALLGDGLVRAYGGGKRQPWCGS